MLIVVATRTMSMPASPAAFDGEGGGGGEVVFADGEDVHVAAVSVPTEEQELVPETVYPESHVGWHVEPLARELVQLPPPPLVGAMEASHGRTA